MRRAAAREVDDRLWETAQQRDQVEWTMQLSEIRAETGNAAMKQKRAGERLGWLLNSFVYRDLQEVDRGDLQRVRLALGLLINDVTSGRWRAPTESIAPKSHIRTPTGSANMLARGRTTIRIAGRDLAEVRYAQARVRSAIEAIVHGDHYQVDVVRDLGGAGCVTAQLRPSHQTPVREWSQVPRRRYVVAVRFDAPLSTCVLITALELLAEVPPQLLRWCPWPVKPHTITPPDLPLRRALRQLNSPGAPRSKPRVSTECGRAFVGKKRQKWCPLHQEAAARERDRRAQQAHRARRRAAQERKAKTEQRRKVR